MVATIPYGGSRIVMVAVYELLDEEDMMKQGTSTCTMHKQKH
jgi:hypothetical protein